jgi:hypothetical protein
VLLALGAAVQAAIVIACLPWIVEWLSRGRWSGEEQAQVVHWGSLLLVGMAIYSATLLPSAWLMLRSQVRAVFFRVSLPWLLGALVVYAWVATSGGPEAAAWANLPVYGWLVVLLGVFVGRGAGKAGGGVGRRV